MNKNEILSSANFKRKCDIVYSANVSYEEYERLENNNTIVLQKTNDYIFYKLKEFEIKSYDTIFCNNFTLKPLFKSLSDKPTLENINLVTHQTDLNVTKEIFNKKPDSIVNWSSINVDFKNETLHPIPLGIGNSFQDKYLNIDKVANNLKIFKFDKEPKIYLNFRENTNTDHRKNLKNIFKNYSWANISDSNLNLSQYNYEIAEHSFALAPWGNGIDTHRIWESLYCGTIPITKYHYTLSTLKDLPVLFVNEYEDISLELLNSTLEYFSESKFNFNKLKVDYWLYEYSKNESSLINIQESKFYNLTFNNTFRLGRYFESKKKIVFYYLRKIFNFLNS